MTPMVSSNLDPPVVTEQTEQNLSVQNSLGHGDSMQSKALKTQTLQVKIPGEQIAYTSLAVRLKELNCRKIAGLTIIDNCEGCSSWIRDSVYSKVLTTHILQRQHIKR